MYTVPFRGQWRDSRAPIHGALDYLQIWVRVKIQIFPKRQSSQVFYRWRPTHSSYIHVRLTTLPMLDLSGCKPLVSRGTTVSTALTRQRQPGSITTPSMPHHHAAPKERLQKSWKYLDHCFSRHWFCFQRRFILEFLNKLFMNKGLSHLTRHLLQHGLKGTHMMSLFQLAMYLGPALVKTRERQIDLDFKNNGLFASKYGASFPH